MVATMVSKLEFEGVGSKGLAHHLVTHADAEGGHLADNLLCDIDSIRHC